jgi:hypothetical protein
VKEWEGIVFIVSRWGVGYRRVAGNIAERNIEAASSGKDCGPVDHLAG